MDGTERGGEVDRANGRRLLVAMAEFLNVPQRKYLVCTCKSSAESGLGGPRPRVTHRVEPSEKHNSEDLCSNGGNRYKDACAPVNGSCVFVISGA
ncbi:unnamed protein product [Dibothriocephalus latus]|uniref:Uncharacterized protein n=1 Tax=Dibothriocephalus latus TaxID=60516 RepID=A0A3P7MFG4_DIBLA|nr:unnamed protein product [Dibothriocephalus latus]